MPKEVEITVNGVKLSERQASTVHVALNNFYFDLKDGLLENDLITEKYMEDIRSIQKITTKGGAKCP